MIVYFDSSVFLSILNGDSSAKRVRDLLVELQESKIRIYTSIVTIQEVSVDIFKDGTIAKDNYAQVKKLARIEGITRDVAITAAKLEAQIIDGYKDRDEKSKDNKRRKWDCFHIATAQCLECTWLYSFDDGMLSRESQLRIKKLKFSLPAPLKQTLFNAPEDSHRETDLGKTKGQTAVAPSPPVSRSPSGSSESDAPTETAEEKGDGKAQGTATQEG